MVTKSGHQEFEKDGQELRGVVKDGGRGPDNSRTEVPVSKNCKSISTNLGYRRY